MPPVDPRSAANAALAAYDKDGDRSLSTSELANCPGILANLSEYDTDGDSQISAAEIVQRIEGWQATRKGLIGGYSCHIYRNGRPLVGAEVRFVPEPFLGDSVKPASGTTDETGTAFLAIDPQDLPSTQSGLRGVHFGVYKVEITHPTVNIGDQYNKATTIGVEIYPLGIAQPVTFNLR